MKRVFLVILIFPLEGNAEIERFCISLASETQFSLFSTRRGAPKRSFCCFLTFRRGGNAIFVNFWLSPGWGDAVFVDFDFLSREKRDFHRFEAFIRG